MAMKRLVQIFLALSFATLQCVAPLAHAHIGGSADHRIHLPEIQQQAHTELSCCAETHDSPSIGVAQGCERDDEPAPPGNSVAAYVHRTPEVAIAGTVRIACAPEHQLALPTLSVRKPYSQAPPALG